MENYFIWDIKPYIEIGFIKLRYYSMFFALAFIFSYQILKKSFRRDNISVEVLDKLFVFGFFAIILGARLGHVFFYEIDLFKKDIVNVFLPFSFDPNFHFTGYSGLASHGATIALIVSLFYFSYKHFNNNFLLLLDHVCVPIALGAFFVRLGNFFNSEIIGKPSDAFYAIIFKNQSFEYGAIVPRHPSQLYEAVLYLLLFAILYLLQFKMGKRLKNGVLFSIFFMALWVIRFFVEFTKEPQGDEYLTLGHINTGQLLSVPLVLIGLFTMVYALKKNPV